MIYTNINTPNRTEPAVHGKYLHGGDGIVARDIEETLEHIGRLARDGMKTTDEVIIDIMNGNRGMEDPRGL